MRMKGNISPQVFSTDLEILNVFKKQGWSILSINPNNAEPAYLFFSSDLLTSHYVGLWSGAYGEMTRSELVVAFQKEAAGIPEDLAQCVAWFLTDRGKLTGVFSSMESHPDTADILGDEMIISQAEGDKYWVVFQHAEGAAIKPLVAPVKVDSTTGHFSFHLPDEMASWGEFHGRITEEDDLIGIFDNGYSVKLPRKASFWQ